MSESNKEPGLRKKKQKEHLHEAARVGEGSMESTKDERMNEKKQGTKDEGSEWTVKKTQG